MSAVSLEQRLMALIDDLAGDANAVAGHMAHGGAERLDKEKVRGDVPRFALSPNLIGLARGVQKEMNIVILRLGRSYLNGRDS